MNSTLRIIFAGTHEIGLPALQALIASPYQVCAVYTQLDRPAGRGQKIKLGAIKQLALQHQIPVFQPVTLRNAEEQAQLRHFKADLMIVIGYGLLLPKAILDAPNYGCWNAHISLLPRWRGAAPAQRAILAGDQETGVTLMQMNEGLDTGDILKQKKCLIYPEDTSETLHHRLANLCAEILLESLSDLLAGQLQPAPQDNSKATYASKIEKSEAKIDWHDSAVAIDRKVRAFNPWPVAFAEYQSQSIRIWKTQSLPERSTAAPGTILQIDKHGIAVATTDGILKILELQLAGGKRLRVGDFINARRDFFTQGGAF